MAEKIKKKILFAENLKGHRERLGITQAELADKLGFSAKSISKWENKRGLPTVEALAELAQLFGLSTEELLFGSTDEKYLLAIDGGGTKTAFALCDMSGKILKMLYKGATNPNDVGMETARSILGDGIREICRGYSYGSIYMYAGISGGTTGDNREILKKFFSGFGFCAADNGSDADNAVALGREENEIFIILGTGIIAYAKKGSRIKRISGWGQHFDDGGSGYNLGRDAIYADLRYTDGRGKPTLISDLIRERTGENSADHLIKFYRYGKKYIAGFAEVVFEAYNAGDDTAAEILEKNMRAVADIINAAAAFIGQRAVRVNFFGGIAERSDCIFPIIEKYIDKKHISLVKCDTEPVFGAVRLAERLAEKQ